MGRKWAIRLTLIALVFAVSFGCNPLTAPLVLMNGGYETKFEAEYPLVSKDKKGKGEVKVLVLCSFPGNVPEDFIGVERSLGVQFSQALQGYAAKAKQVVTVVPMSKLEKYQSEHPDWATMHPSKLGEYFEADYVIDLHIKSISLFEYGSRHLFRGRTSISIEAYKVGDMEADPSNMEYNGEYPKGHSPDISDMPPAKFKLNFLKRVGSDISWKFVPHLTSEDFHQD